MQTSNQSSLRLNQWITPERKQFSYLIYWPYADIPNPIEEVVDIYVHIGKGKTRGSEITKTDYIGTFITLEEVRELFERFRENGECANGTYQILNKDILVNEISHEIIEKTLEDLIEKSYFFKYFTEVCD